ncbi:MAG: hypothetical protein U0414_33150 [Polyangiaceae bacterium]
MSGRARRLGSFAAVHDLGLRRALLDEALASDAAALASDLEEVFSAAAMGEGPSRDAALAVASWIGRVLARGDRAALAPLHAAAASLERPLVAAIFAPRPAARALARRGRLAEVCIPARRSLDPFAAGPLGRGARGAPPLAHRLREMLVHRHREHPDPIFIGRLLDAPWIRTSDAVAIAARRPTSEEIALSVATRDRFFREPPVRLAIASNPFSPPELRAALSAAMRVEELRVL